MTGASRSEHLFDCMQQPIVVFKHDAVELVATSLVDFPALQSLQIKADRCNGRFKLVSDSVDEAVVLFVAPDFADQEDRVQDQSGDDEQEEDNAQYEQGDLPPMQDNPPDVERHRQRDKADAQNDEKIDRFPLTR